MNVEIDDAMHQLDDLILMAEAGEEIVLTLSGRPTVRLVPIAKPLTANEKAARIDAIVPDARSKALPGPDAARSADFLYGPDGLPI